jgi:hypothetical protein
MIEQNAIPTAKESKHQKGVEPPLNEDIIN